jgi:Mn2+/Fe2+ NRAMP family transporter
MTGKTKAKAWWRKLARFIGPGFVSGASGDDPAGIATFSQAGAGFGYAMGWTMVARDRTVMGDFALTWPWKILGWLTLAVMAAAAAGMLLTL